MRLPALTAGQCRHEASRAFHEAIWEAYQQGERLILATEDAHRTQAAISGNRKRFWIDRGFLFKTKTVDGGLQVWIQVSEGPPAAVYGVRR